MRILARANLFTSTYKFSISSVSIDLSARMDKNSSNNNYCYVNHVMGT